MSVQYINNLTKTDLIKNLEKCCGSEKWINEMTIHFPVKSKEELMNISEKVWYNCHADDWLEAFRNHPKIGDLQSLKKKYGATQEWASMEQGSIKSASIRVLEYLSLLNMKYEIKFGFIFIVCATGKSPEVLLDLLKKRLKHTRSKEIKIAMEEQNKITKLRLEKLLNEGESIV